MPSSSEKGVSPRLSEAGGVEAGLGLFFFRDPTVGPITRVTLGLSPRNGATPTGRTFRPRRP